jgi:hypothetical protein
MAEALGLAASIAGVAGLSSLAIQLGQGLFKLKELHRKFRDAPETLQQAIWGISNIELQMKLVQSYIGPKEHYSQESALLDATLELCRRSVCKINDLIDDVETQWKRANFRGKLKILTTERAMREYLQRLIQEQSILMFAVNIYSEWVCGLVTSSRLLTDTLQL